MGGARKLVWVKGAGDLATGVAYRLLQAGFPVVLTDLDEPLCVRRTVSFAEAIPSGRTAVEGYMAVRVRTEQDVAMALTAGQVPVAADPNGILARRLQPYALVDAVMAKRNTGTSTADAPVVIALGPGFSAGADCHAVVETNRGHYLGRVIYKGKAAPDTGEPGPVAGVSGVRVLRAPIAGIFRGRVEIGAMVRPDDQVGEVCPTSGGAWPVVARVGGVLRGLIRTGIQVAEGTKVGDIDPTCEAERCYTISDKALAVGGGVLEAILQLSLPIRPC